MAQRFYFLAGGGAFCRGTEDIPIFDIEESGTRLVIGIDDFLSVFDTFARNDAYIDADSVTIGETNVRRQYSTPTRCTTITAATGAVQPTISEQVIIAAVTETTAIWDDGAKLLYWVTDVHTQTARRADSGARYFLINFSVEMSFEFLLALGGRNKIPLCGIGRAQLINPPTPQDGTEAITTGIWVMGKNLSLRKIPPLSDGVGRAVNPSPVLSGFDAPARTDYIYIIVVNETLQDVKNAPTARRVYEYGRPLSDTAEKWAQTTLGDLINLAGTNAITVKTSSTTTYDVVVEKIILLPRRLYAGYNATHAVDVFTTSGGVHIRGFGGWEEGNTSARQQTTLYLYGGAETTATADKEYKNGKYAISVGTTTTKLMVQTCRRNTTGNADGQLTTAATVTVEGDERNIFVFLRTNGTEINNVDITDDLAYAGNTAATASQLAEEETNRHLAKIAAVVGTASQAAGSFAAFAAGNPYAGTTGLISAGLSAYEQTKRYNAQQYTTPQKTDGKRDGLSNSFFALGGVCFWLHNLCNDDSMAAGKDPQAGLFGWDAYDQPIVFYPDREIFSLVYAPSNAAPYATYYKIEGLTPCGSDVVYNADFAQWLRDRFAVGVRLWRCGGQLSADRYADYSGIINAGAH